MVLPTRGIGPTAEVRVVVTGRDEQKIRGDEIYDYEYVVLSMLWRSKLMCIIYKTNDYVVFMTYDNI